MSKKIKTRKMLPVLRKVNYAGKKYHYILSQNARSRRKAINEGIHNEMKCCGKTKRQSAIAKKGRLNILRIYRRNKNIKDCRTITRDMLYIDDKYNLGNTSNICGVHK